MKLTGPQQTIIASDARFKVVAAGRRFGKTYASISSMVKVAALPGKRVLYIAPSYRMAKQIVWDDLKVLLGQIRWVKRVNESDLTITLVNGSQIMLRSADNPDSIRGIGADHVVIDEAADIPDLETTWQSVIRPILSDRLGSALIIGSPKGRDFFYDLYLHGQSNENWHSWQFTTADGGNVTPAELEQARADLDERTYNQEYMAQFLNITNIIYYAFADENIAKHSEPLNDRTLLHIGMDFNVDPGCAVVGYQHPQGFHILDEIEIYGTNTHEMVDEIRRRYPQQRVSVYPDASGSQRRTSAHGITDHIILKNAGFDLKVGSVNPAVADRIAAVNSAFCSGTGVRRLSVDPACKRLIEGLRKHTYKEGTRQPSKDTGYDHFNDALGYVVNHLYPLRVDYNRDTISQIRRNTGRF